MELQKKAIGTTWQKGSLVVEVMDYSPSNDKYKLSSGEELYGEDLLMKYTQLKNVSPYGGKNVADEIKSLMKNDINTSDEEISKVGKSAKTEKQLKAATPDDSIDVLKEARTTQSNDMQVKATAVKSTASNYVANVKAAMDHKPALSPIESMILGLVGAQKHKGTFATTTTLTINLPFDVDKIMAIAEGMGVESDESAKIVYNIIQAEISENPQIMTDALASIKI